MQLYSRDDYLYEQTAHARPSEFMRRQSHLFQKLNPQVVRIKFKSEKIAEWNQKSAKSH